MNSRTVGSPIERWPDGRRSRTCWNGCCTTRWMATPARSRADVRVVSAATTCVSADDGVRVWLQLHRRQRTEAIIDRLEGAVAAGELPPDTDMRARGDEFAALLHGLSVQARNHIPRKRHINLIAPAMTMLDSVGSV